MHRHTILKLLSTITFLVSCANARQLAVNYYNDKFCSQWSKTIDVSWAETMEIPGSNCNNYHQGSSSTSLNVAACDAGSWCLCLFYNKENCAGTYSSAFAYGANDENCVHSSGDFKSFRCFFHT
jgi:hypothetical protein